MRSFIAASTEEGGIEDQIAESAELREEGVVKDAASQGLIGVVNYQVGRSGASRDLGSSGRVDCDAAPFVQIETTQIG